ncbi:MAG: segregation/condensation protein A [Gracilibacteraceae bacterium]|jgi:segregation and condensation protein A|nr:segregation/condensation protein A [Gracilibacteraceae bacterium]
MSKNFAAAPAAAEYAEEAGGIFVEVEAFRGPLALLLSLIHQHKVDIYAIPIALIADRFIESLERMERLDLEITSEFLVLAAQLLYLKSRELLPRPQKTEEELAEEESLKQDLVERVIVYRAFREAALFLGERVQTEAAPFFRTIDQEEVWAALPRPNPLEGVPLAALERVFAAVLARAEVGAGEIDTLEVEEIQVDLMIRAIMRRVLLNPEGLLFSRLIAFRSRLELIIAFIAVLELLRGGRLRAVQSGETADIFVVPTAKAREYADLPAAAL